MTRSTFDESGLRGPNAESGPLDELDDPEGPGTSRLGASLRPPEESRRFLPLHGFRAVAAIGVVVYYVAGYSGLWFGESPVAGFLRNLGNFGIAVFFVVSGFLLHRPFVSAWFAGDEPPDPVRYLWRRCLRIFPAYLVALGVYIALGLRATTRPVSPDYYLSLATLTQVYRRGYGFTGLSVAWVVCIGFAFAVALPLLAGAFRGLARLTAGRAGRGGLSLRMKVEAQVVGIGTLVAVSVLYQWMVAAPSQFDPDTYPFSVFHLWLANYLDWFALGMVLAVAVAWRDAGRPLPAPLVNLAERGWLCWVLAAGFYGAYMVLRGTGVTDLTSLVQETPPQMLGRFAFNGLAAFCFVLPGVLGDGLHPINRVLSRTVPVYLGLVSYGIFLWQRVWLDSVKIGHETGPSRYSFPVMLAIVAGLSIVSASVSYLVMERPLQEIRATRRARQSSHGEPVGDDTAMPIDFDQQWPASR